MAKFNRVVSMDIKVDPSPAVESMEALMSDAISYRSMQAAQEIDISAWLGWGEGIAVLDCRICHGKTEGRITYIADGRTAMHKDCMVGVLVEAPIETFEEIRDRLEQGDPLFGEEDE